MDYKDGTPTGGVGIWVWSMVAGGKDQTRKIQIKGRDRNGKNRNGRPKQSGGVGQGQNQERSKGNKRFQKRRKSDEKALQRLFFIKIPLNL